jgi:hypothetical protein
MVLLAHIVIALTSLLVTAFAYIAPSVTKLRVSMVLLGLTVASGTYLVLSAGTHMVQACTTGLLYIGVVSYGIIAARQKLLSAKVKR